VRTAQHSYRPSLAKEVAQGIGQLGRLGEGTDEDQIEIGRKLLQKVFHPGVTHHLYLMPFLLTPDADHLGHDARQVGVHNPSVQGWIWTFGYEI
jgi:hypothetical protein